MRASGVNKERMQSVPNFEKGLMRAGDDIYHHRQGGSELIRVEWRFHAGNPHKRILFGLRNQTVFDGVVENVLDVIEVIVVVADDVVEEGFLPTEWRETVVCSVLGIESLVERFDDVVVILLEISKVM